MGDWMTVNITGTCDADEAEKLREWLTFDYLNSTFDREAFGPLTISGGLAGLGEWPGSTIHRIGNVFERDYTPECVADHLRRCLVVAPSLRVFVDCGGAYESLECIATVAIDEDGTTVSVLPPRVPQLEPISEDQLMAAMFKALGR